MFERRMFDKQKDMARKDLDRFRQETESKYDNLHKEHTKESEIAQKYSREVFFQRSKVKQAEDQEQYIEKLKSKLK